MSLVKSDSQSLFKLPKAPPRKKKTVKQKVLEEETYLEEMGKIIERDFFPDLGRLKAQNAYLDAQNENDVLKLQQISSKYSVNMERESSPATFETPVNKTGLDDDICSDNAKCDEEVVREIPKTKLGLDQYLGSHTSEDNKSFEDIIVESQEQHKQKHPWLFKEDPNANEKALEKLSIEYNAAVSKPLELDTWTYKDKNYIMYVPDGVSLTPEEKVESAKRRKEIVHSNTRLKVNPFDENENKERILDLAQNQVRCLDGKIGVDGKVVVPSTPKINGFSFVKTPSPAPGVNESPLMTWGEIDGTPFRLDATPLAHVPSFHMPEPPKRESLALKLADKAGERHRDRKKKAIEAARRQLTSPAGRPHSDRLQMLSPAARRLASTQMQRVGSDKRLAAYYSPRASPVPNSTPTPVAATVTTDNLLNLNVKRRPRAADFFS